ncbi:MAG: FAD-binding oxidoreductase [Chloroflexi bacterium]|nr:FAD-binding oxidoreductase [Chloroflexota bacterium]
MAQQTADCLIIGGGISGVSTAYQLALRGHRVILLERRYLAAGGTGRTVGLVRQHYSTETTARMALRSLQVWQDFENAVGGDVGWVPTGALFIVAPHDLDGLKANVELQKRVGINTEFLDPLAVLDLAPYLYVDDIGGAAYEPGSGVADGAMATTAYAERAKALGAAILQGVEVTSICVEGGRVTGVETPQGRFSAPVVINAAGPWGPKLAQQLGYDTPVESSRHQVAVFQRPESLADRHPFIGDFIQGFYLRSETGRLTLSGSLEASEAANRVDPDHYDEAVDMDFNLEMAEYTEHRIPPMGEAELRKGWAGLYDVTPDWHPIIGKMPGLDGFICAFGWSGSGFKMAPVTGEMLADLATGEQRCPIDPHPFRFERFAEGELITGQYSYSIMC